jgi:arylsulfatase A-like enzyme
MREQLSDQIPKKDAPMNVLLIMVDEWRYDTLSVAGHPVVQTPAIDALAARGTRFTEAYCASPLCGPSRVSFMTGQYVSRHGGWSNGAKHHVRPDQDSLVRQLHAAGYRLGHAGKNHTFQDATFDHYFSSREEYNFGKTHGEIRADDKQVRAYRQNDKRPYFNKFFLSDKAPLGEGLHPDPEPFPPDLCPTARIAEDGIRFLEQEHDKPFFLHLSFPDPHWPNVVCEPYFSRYDPAALPPLEAWPMDWEGHPFKHFVQSRACEFDRYTAAERQRILATYYGQCTFIDDALSRVLGRLRELGLEQNTLVIFAADHGNFAGRYGLVGKTGGFFDALIRIPLIMAGPGVPAGRVSEAAISNIDLAPTILDYLQLPVLPGAQGRSFRRVLEGVGEDHRDEVYVEVGSPQPPPPPRDRLSYDAYNRERCERDGWFWFIEYVMCGRAAMIRRDGWKYAFNAGDLDELYHIAEDPLELNNLAADPAFAKQREQLRDLLFDRLLTVSLSHNSTP